MKKILAFAVLAVLVGFTTACEKEVLEPTQMENNWAQKIDFSNSYVKQLYEQTGVAILTEYNDTTDVFYQGSDFGVINSVTLTHLSAANKDKAIEWLKTNIMDCFSTECIKKYFPRRIFLCNTLIAQAAPGHIGPWMREMRYSNNLWGVQGSQHAMAFAQGFMVCINDVLFNTDTQVDYQKQFRNDIMSLLCFELFMKNDWVEGIRDNIDLFPEDLTELYGCRIQDTESNNPLGGNKYVTKKGMWRIWYGASHKDPRKGDEVSKNDYNRVSLEGYFQFGFPDTGINDNKAYGGAFSWPTGTPTTYKSTNYDGYTSGLPAKEYQCDGFLSISNTQGTAPNGPLRDSRNLIGALVDLNDLKLTVYGEFLIHRLWAMSEYMKELGVDFKKFNPVVDTMYQMHAQN